MATDLELKPLMKNHRSSGISICKSITWVFPQIGVGPPNHPMFNRVFHYNLSILGYHYFWKHPTCVLPEISAIVY